MKTYSSKSIATILRVSPATARTIMDEIGTIGVSKQYRISETALHAWLSRMLGHEFASNDFRLYGPEEVSKILNISKVTARKVIQKCGGFTMNRRVRVPKIYFDYWLSEQGGGFAQNIPKYDNSIHHSSSRLMYRINTNLVSIREFSSQINKKSLNDDIIKE